MAKANRRERRLARFARIQNLNDQPTKPLHDPPINQAQTNPNPRPDEKKQDGLGDKSQSGWKAALLFAAIFAITSFITTLKGNWHEWWSKWLIIPATLIACGVAVYEVLLHFKVCKTKKVAGGIAGAVFILIGSVTVFAYVSSPLESHDFVVISKTRMGSPTVGSAAMWFLHPTPPKAELVISPIQMVEFIQFTSTKTYPFRIEFYVIEAEMEGKWVELRQIDERFGRLFFGRNLREASEFDMSANGFNAAIEKKDIEPNRTVEGWILINGLGLNQPKRRFRFADATGKHYSVPITTIGGGGTAIQRMGLKLKPPGKQDISGYRMVP